MRKNSPRKWLHACLDLLPVILIPVFMIYSHRHDIASQSSYSKEEPVYYESNVVENNDDLTIGNIYEFHYKDEQYPNAQLGRFDVLEIYPSSYSSFLTNTTSGSLDKVVNIFDYNEHHYFRYYFIQDGVSYYSDYWDFVGLIVYNNNSNKTDIYTYFSFTNQKVVSGYQDVTFDFDKDIMGVFMNNFNFTINKYFNMGNVFNLTGVYDWFNTNIFNGNAPQIIYSVWNIAIYELVMDLLFLLYGLFMWFIDMVQHLMDKPFKSVK